MLGCNRNDNDEGRFSLVVVLFSSGRNRRFEITTAPEGDFPQASSLSMMGLECLNGPPA